MWNMSPITRLLKDNNINIHIETSGAYKFSGNWDWICLSPKKNKNPLNEIYSKADELKMIIYNLDDLKFAEIESKKVSNSCLLYMRKELISPIHLRLF